MDPAPQQKLFLWPLCLNGEFDWVSVSCVCRSQVECDNQTMRGMLRPANYFFFLSHRKMAERGDNICMKYDLAENISIKVEWIKTHKKLENVGNFFLSNFWHISPRSLSSSCCFFLATDLHLIFPSSLVCVCVREWAGSRQHKIAKRCKFYLKLFSALK